jgi:adenylate kinase family enzyme
MRQLVILRGPSGSGKSTLAESIVANAKTQHGESLPVVVLSTDDFFTDENGVYNFSVRQLSKAHFWNQKRCEFAV